MNNLSRMMLASNGKISAIIGAFCIVYSSFIHLLIVILGMLINCNFYFKNLRKKHYSLFDIE